MRSGLMNEAWQMISISKRPDIIGVRTLESGQREFLIHNNVFCFPYYTVKEVASKQ